MSDPTVVALALAMANALIHCVLGFMFRLRRQDGSGRRITVYMRAFFAMAFMSWGAQAAYLEFNSISFGLLTSLCFVVASIAFICATTALAGGQPSTRFWIFTLVGAVLSTWLGMQGMLAYGEALLGLIIGAELAWFHWKHKKIHGERGSSYFVLLGCFILFISVIRLAGTYLFPDMVEYLNAMWLAMLAFVSNVSIVVLMLSINMNIQAELNSQALTDPLTGLMNRRALLKNFHAIRAEVGRNNNRLGLIVCDLDHFKKVNDAYGHDVGDGVLIAFAGVLRRACRTNDMIARFGGEEFVVLLQNADMQAVYTLAERIRKDTCRQSLRVAEVDVTCTVSLGGGVFDGHENFEQAFSRIDTALYRAKHEGRNKVELAPVGGRE